MKTWQLRKGADKRFKAGHPWVFSNELTASPKGTPSGENILLLDGDGRFAAYGYGNPNSLISFRALSYSEGSPVDQKLLDEKIRRAFDLRKRFGLTQQSHRLVFAEGDQLPGLIIDRYLISSANPFQVFVIQSSTAGMDKLLPLIFESLSMLVSAQSLLSWDRTALVTANTSKSRQLEGIPIETKKVIKPIGGQDLNIVTGTFQSADDTEKSIELDFNILGGQKTGFFLDQRENIQLVIDGLKRQKSQAPIRVLDLCCYVGQWSAQIAKWGKDAGREVECTLYDSSEEALTLATRNVQRQGGKAITVKGDVMSTLRGVIERHYDVVICDPPAFIKKKKDVPTGKAAYAKLNREAIKKVSDGGLFVSCSCSGLFFPDDFRDMLATASFSPGHSIQWVKQGFHSPDHPQRLEFPEGGYLKCFMGIVTLH